VRFQVFKEYQGSISDIGALAKYALEHHLSFKLQLNA
jgi:hypothetical protein